MSACLPVTLSPGYIGGVRAHAQKHEALARVVVRPQVVVAGVMQKVAGVRLVDADTIQLCRAAIDDLPGASRFLSLQKV
jgi:chromate reductase